MTKQPSPKSPRGKSAMSSAEGCLPPPAVANSSGVSTRSKDKQSKECSEQQQLSLPSMSGGCALPLEKNVRKATPSTGKQQTVRKPRRSALTLGPMRSTRSNTWKNEIARQNSFGRLDFPNDDAHSCYSNASFNKSQFSTSIRVDEDVLSTYSDEDFCATPQFGS